MTTAAITTPMISVVWDEDPAEATGAGVLVEAEVEVPGPVGLAASSGFVVWLGAEACSALSGSTMP
jgi:hypothetical protein